ncbi:hypothetical protein CRENPOLYSF1_180028 [Crenothrix polyspora]|uniref:Uncharacterized protein n=1 Tax=Crenothrix polyspora TaxID=360316 RepID=A0A1R4H4J1_9GAMM|nr:hypothetical protein CRENPOLYSF1_180028 [Crenothrix polyspora]
MSFVSAILGVADAEVVMEVVMEEKVVMAADVVADAGVGAAEVVVKIVLTVSPLPQTLARK